MGALSILFIIWLMVFFAAEHIASRKGNSGCGFIILALLLPIVALIVAIVQLPNEEKLNKELLARGKKIQCSACKSIIHPEATICPQCRTEVVTPLPALAESPAYEVSETIGNLRNNARDE